MDQSSTRDINLKTAMDNKHQTSPTEAPACSSLFRGLWLFTGDMRVYGAWLKRQRVLLQFADCVFRGVAQVMFVNNPFSGLLITAGLFLQDPWCALNALLATAVSTGAAIVLGQNRRAISAGLYGYNGTLVGMMMSVFSTKGAWYWWLLLPNMCMSILCPVVSSALSTVSSQWEVPVFTLPFNILVSVHMAATGANHTYFPQVLIEPKHLHHPHNATIETMDFSQLCLSVPVGVGQIYGCDSPWTAGLFLLALLVSSPTICCHAMLGSAVGTLTGISLAAPSGELYSGMWGYNSALSCIAIGGMFYVLTWQTHLLAVTCAFFSAYMSAAITNCFSILGLPACTWPFCLSTLVFLLFSSERPSLCKLPLAEVSYPERNRNYWRKIKGHRKAAELDTQRIANRDEDLPVETGPDWTEPTHVSVD